jgi:predicted permease
MIARGTHGLDTLAGDLRFALRHFVRNPLSTLTMVAVLSIGIAINVVLFTMVHSVTDRPPSAVEASDDLARIRGSQLRDGSRSERAFSLDEVEGYAGLTSHFAEVAAWTSRPVTAGAPGVEEFTVTATFVTDEYFPLLGVQPVRGRGLVAGDAAQVAVLSHAAWTRSLAQGPDVVGRTIALGDVPFTIVGVAPPRFRGAAWEARDDMQVWLPLSSHARVFPDVPNDAEVFFAIGRLQPGMTREAAGTAALVVAGRITSDRRNEVSDAASLLARDASVEVAPLLADNLEPGAEANLRFATLAFGLLGLLTLLVTCANVGSLQTGLALARRREIAIRMSLGAHRGRLIRQLVTESLLLSLLSGVGAVVVTLALLRALLGIVGNFSFELVFDRTTILFAFGVALVAGLLFGLSPALHATRVAIAGVLKDSAGAVAGGRARLQRGLVVAQIALTQPLAVCVATLVLIGFSEYRENPPNPYGERIVQLRLTSAGAWQPTGDAAATDPGATERERLETERLVDALRRAPGITHATFVPSRAPIHLEAFTLPNGAMTSSEDATAAFYLLGRAAMPGYLDLIGTPIVLGRDLGAADTAGFRTNTIPIVIGDDMARRVWGDASPIGRRVERAAAKDPMTLEVVGVYREEVASLGHSRNPFNIFVPPDPRLTPQAASRLIMLRVSSTPEAVTPVVRGIVRDEAPRTAIMELRTLAALQDEERFILWGAIALFSSAGLVVLLLCALGLYAVVAFAVGQRTGEIAVRMAIGARARQIVRHFACDGLRLTMIGVVLGLPISVLGLRQLISLAPEVPDVSVPLVMTVVAVGLITVAGLASWLPASRAAEVDPAVILRKE